jgi:adenine-specific DNA-methyltransferase
LSEYRSALAKKFKKADESLDGEAVTEITQRVLDRLVFIRFLEDKGIEPIYRVSSYGESSTAWNDFIADCRSLDSIYNGIVFKEHAVLDSPTFQIEDGVFADICERLSHQNSPYDFNAIPIHVLGSIYERFLGSVITASAHNVKVEEKPEVRHAGGVYYTPEFIVRNIVSETVGSLIEGKTPVQIAKMRFADIACGSGSFLLSVFDTLIRYHAQYYNDHPETAEPPARGKKKNTPPVFERDGALHLTLAKKRQILVENIFGVDIDAQAVEVAQLSLYLRLLEDETISSTKPGQLEIREAVLPSLGRNIVCGNSLVGTDILSRQIIAREREHRLNAMDISDRFPAVFKEGGFDAVVGNPPYIRVQVLQQTQPEACEYLQANYVSAAEGNFDIYVAFIERALRVIRPGGFVGYIVPISS